MTTIETPVPTTGAPLELPVHLTGFIGRDRELSELERLLPAARLLTLTGAGGSGKTRLARELAVRASGSFDRAGWVDLAPIATGDLVAQQIATALHIHERPGVSATESAAACAKRFEAPVTKASKV